MSDEDKSKILVEGERRKQRVKDLATGKVTEFEVIIRKVAKPKG